MSRPLAIDLFSGLGGWTEGLLAEGYDVIGFDVERHIYGEMAYPAQLVLQDVLTLRGSQFRDAQLIVASPPCQEYSYMAMPWKRAKQIERALLGRDGFPEGYTGSRTVDELTALFDACFRIQREACEAAGRHIPLVVENVCGAQKWVGPAKWRHGSYYLWGDVPALMPIIPPRSVMNFHGHVKNPGQDWNRHKQTGEVSPHWRMEATKNTGGSWFNIGSPGQTVTNRNPVHEHVKQGGDWFSDASPGSLRNYASKSSKRKAASAMIAKIPLELSRHIAVVYKPKLDYSDQFYGFAWPHREAL